MDAFKFRYYEQKPCKFILRSGKQIFGIIWKDSSEHVEKFFFSSVVEFMNANLNNKEDMIKAAYPIKLDELIHAELL